jgi:hypothetical protein
MREEREKRGKRGKKRKGKKRRKEKKRKEKKNTMRMVCLMDSRAAANTVSTNFRMPSATEHDTVTAVAYDTNNKNTLNKNKQ